MAQRCKNSTFGVEKDRAESESSPLFLSYCQIGRFSDATFYYLIASYYTEGWNCLCSWLRVGECVRNVEEAINSDSEGVVKGVERGVMWNCGCEMCVRIVDLEK